MNYKTLISAGMALLLGATASSVALSRPNIIFLLADDLGYMDITPFSPPSGPARWLFQGPPAESKLLAVTKTCMLLVLLAVLVSLTRQQRFAAGAAGIRVVLQDVSSQRFATKS